MCIDPRFAALRHSPLLLLDIDPRAVLIAPVSTRRNTHTHTEQRRRHTVFINTHARTHTHAFLRSTEREREGVSRTRCECLGARWCYWFGRHHGNPPHLSATAAEGSRRAHASVYVNAYTHTYSSIFPPLQLSVFFSPCIHLVSFPSASSSSSLKFSPRLHSLHSFLLLAPLILGHMLVPVSIVAH